MTPRQKQLEKLELKRGMMREAGLVSERYPEVSSIVFSMTYYHRALDSAVMKRTVNFIPSDYACFRMDCTRDECTNGGFDLAPVVAALVKKRKKSIKGKVVCRGTGETLRAGHASSVYEISIQYARPDKSKKLPPA